MGVIGQNQSVQTGDVVGVLKGTERCHCRAVSQVKITQRRQIGGHLNVAIGGVTVIQTCIGRETGQMSARRIQVLQIGTITQINVGQLCTPAHVKPFERCQVVFQHDAVLLGTRQTALGTETFEFGQACCFKHLEVGSRWQEDAVHVGAIAHINVLEA